MMVDGPASAGLVSPRMMIALVAPAVAGTCLVLVVACAEMLGATPFSLVPRNVAEAAAMANAADARWFLQRGADASRVEDVRPEIVSPAITRLTALEAAVWSRQPELLAMFDRLGAIRGDVRSELACLARDLEAEDIVEYLDPGDSGACEAGAAYNVIAARTPGAVP
jgi:hypothetical protein